MEGRLRWEGKWQLQCNSQIEKTRSVAATLHKRPSYGATAAFSKFLFFFIIGGGHKLEHTHTHPHRIVLRYIYRTVFSVALSLKLDSVKPPFTWCGFVFKMFSNKRCVCVCVCLLPCCVGCHSHRCCCSFFHYFFFLLHFLFFQLAKFVQKVLACHGFYLVAFWMFFK